METREGAASSGVDMSSDAIDRRLRELSTLFDLARTMRGARWLGSVDDLRAAERERGGAPGSGSGTR